VVLVDEPDVVPLLVPEFVPVPVLWVVFVVFVRDVLVEFQGCHTKSAISATTTITATKLKVAKDPPFSRSTEMLRSSIRDSPSQLRSDDQCTHEAERATAAAA
jgi:hypothetical protein